MTPSDKPTEPGGVVSNARLAAELQAVALAIRIGGLEGLANGSVTLGPVRAHPSDGESK